MKSRDIAIEFAKFFETKLVAKGATGRGLHEKVSSIEAKLTPKLTQDLRKIASIRNKQLHESDTPEIEIEKFVMDGLKLAFSLGELMDMSAPPMPVRPNDMKTAPAILHIAAHVISAPRNQTIKPDVIPPRVAELHSVFSTTEETVLANVTNAPSDTSSETLSGVSDKDRSIAVALALRSQVPDEYELEKLIDESITKAHAVYYPVYKRWHGFLFLAEQTNSLVDERLKSLALAVAAGAELSEMVELAKEMGLTPFES
ncbi:MAG: hypothetical protein ACYCSZ_07175 [Burkholderiales bacterium]